MAISEPRPAFSRLEAKRREQTPQALARLVIVGLFIALWWVLWVVRIPMPVPFLLVLLAETAFFLLYLPLVSVLPTPRSIDWAQYGMLGAEIVFHTTIVYFLGGISWLGAFAYVFGLIFTNTFLDLRRGLVYTGGACLAFSALVLLEATGAIPHYAYLDQSPLRYQDSRFVATTLIAALGVFFSIHLWVNWVGRQLRKERDGAIQMQEELFKARSDLQQANEELERRVQARTAELQQANELLQESEERLRTVITNVPVVLFSLNRDGVYTLIEGQGLTTLGVDNEGVVGRSTFDIFEDRPEVSETVRRALQGEAVTMLLPIGRQMFQTRLFPMTSDGVVDGVIGIAMDVTEEHRVQEALRESEERFRRLTENAADIILRFRVGEERGFEYVSPAVEAILGYQPEEFYADPDLGMRIIHSDDRQTLQEMIKQDDPRSMVFRWTAKDGAQVWLDSRTVAIRDEAGKLVAIEGVMRDVTERKRWEDALRESEERFRTIFEEGPLGMAIIGHDQRFLQVNATLCSMLGYTEEELVQRSIADVSEPSDAESNASLARDVFAGNIPSLRIERRSLTKGGRTIWISITASTIHGPDGAVRYILSMIEDITERKRWEDALRESEAKFRAMAETVAAAAFIFQGEKMRYVNPAAERITGYTHDEMLHMKFWDVIHPDFREQVAQRGLARQRGEDVPTSYEVKLVRKDGEERWVHFTAGTIDYDGRPAVLGTAFDITERKRAEAALHRIAKHDHLTGLLNRGAGFDAIEERLLAARARGGRLAVLVLDLDRFKRINDRFGHEQGDAALRHFAALLKALVGDRGVLCRLGGDEFEIALDDAALPQALEFADELLSALRSSIAAQPEERMPRFAASVGIACYPEDGDTFEVLRRRADDAMYAAKAGGGDRRQAWRELPPSRAA